MDDGFVRITDEGRPLVAYLDDSFPHKGDVLVVVALTDHEIPEVDDINGAERGYLSVSPDGSVEWRAPGRRWVPVTVEPLTDQTRAQWMAMLGEGDARG